MKNNNEECLNQAYSHKVYEKQHFSNNDAFTGAVKNCLASVNKDFFKLINSEHENQCIQEDDFIWFKYYLYDVIRTFNYILCSVKNKKIINTWNLTPFCLISQQCLIN